MKLLLRLCVMTFCLSLSIAVLADGIDKRSQTEGKFLDPSCNCERPRKADGPIDKDLLDKIRKNAGDPKKDSKEDAKKLLAKVKSYRCPKAKPKDKDDFGLDDDMELDASEILDTLIVKAEIDSSRLDSDIRDRAEEALEKKFAKCRQEAMAKQGGSGSSMATGNSQNQSMQYMYRMMQMYQMQQQSMSAMYGMGGMYGNMYGMNMGFGLNNMTSNPWMYSQQYPSYPYYQTGTLIGYSGINTTMTSGTGLTGYSPVNTSMLGMNSTAGLLGASGSLPYYRSYQNTGVYSPLTYWRGY